MSESLVLGEQLPEIVIDDAGNLLPAAALEELTIATNVAAAAGPELAHTPPHAEYSDHSLQVIAAARLVAEQLREQVSGSYDVSELLKALAGLANGYRAPGQQASAELDLYDLVDELHVAGVVTPASIRQHLANRYLAAPTDPQQSLQDFASKLALAPPSQQADTSEYELPAVLAQHEYDLAA